MNNKILDVAIHAAKEAGKIQLEKLGKLKYIHTKYNQDNNLVTEADNESESKIFKIIKDNFPEHALLSEESGDLPSESEYKWIIDPLDGTVNYAHSVPIFSTSIGIEKDGQIIVGVVYDPSRDELFTAVKNKGAFLNGQKIEVSDTNALGRAMLVTGFPYNVKDNPFNCIEHFKNFLLTARAVRRLGSAALDACYVACGRFDGFWEVSLNPWDMAAGSLIIEEAGGKVSGFDSEKLDIYSESFLATNGLIHDQMLDILKRGFT
jgi:myo-inositol-1(or 4)-monophosphatase